MVVMRSLEDAPRTRNAAATKEAMLQAARRRFLAESYDNVGMRDIARDVGVDVALVARYFGSKEGLFAEVLRAGKKKGLEPQVPVEELPAYLADMLTAAEHDRQAKIEHLLIILRSASSPQAAEIVRAGLKDDVLEPVAKLLPGANGQIRACMALGVMIGATVMRTIMAVEPLCGCDRNIIRDKLTRLFETALADEDEASKPTASARNT